MKKLMSFVFFLVILCACDAKSKKTPEHTSTGVFRLGDPMQPVRNLTLQEQQLLEKSCLALQDKHIEFLRQRNLKFSFARLRRRCNSDVVDTLRNITLGTRFVSGDQLEWDAGTSQFIKDFETDEVGVLERLCRGVNHHNPPDELENITNTYVIGRLQRQYRFLVMGQDVRVQVNHYALDPNDGNFKSSIVEELEIISGNGPSVGIRRGMVKRRIQVESCLGGLSSEAFEQNLL